MTTWGGDKQVQVQVCATHRPYFLLSLLDRRVPPQARSELSYCISRSRIQMYFFDFGQAASRPCWRPRNHPCCYEELQATALQIWRVLQGQAPRSGSKLYYTNPWAMYWPSDHPKRPLTGLAWDQASIVWLSVLQGKANLMQSKSTPISSNAKSCQTKIKGLDVRGHTKKATKKPQKNPFVNF